MEKNTIIILGACHYDIVLRLKKGAQLGCTNLATAQHFLGGVAANIARYFGEKILSSTTRPVETDFKINFVCVATKKSTEVVADIREMGIEVTVIKSNGIDPFYTAIMSIDGELLIGACETSLYENLSPGLLVNALPVPTSHVIMDANYPLGAIQDVVTSLDDGCEIYAAGTSVEKVLRFAPILGRIDALALNRKEAESLLGVRGTTEKLAVGIVRKLRSNRSLVLVSDGAASASLCSKNITEKLRPPEVNLTTANGAGDVMTGAFFWQLMYGQFDRGDLWTSDDLNKILSNSLNAGAAFAASNSHKLAL